VQLVPGVVILGARGGLGPLDGVTRPGDQVSELGEAVLPLGDESLVVQLPRLLQRIGGERLVLLGASLSGPTTRS
jgi:hypothetical protein